LVKKDNNLQIINTSNNDGPWAKNLAPLIVIDIWEHSYYLDYGFNCREYVEKIIDNLLNWNWINENYTKVLFRENKSIILR
jgi:Fe-Mn family superoxide dismutase